MPLCLSPVRGTAKLPHNTGLMQRKTLGPGRRIAGAVLAEDLDREPQRLDVAEPLSSPRGDGNPHLRAACLGEGDALRADLDRLLRGYVKRVRRPEVEQQVG